MKIGLLSDTHGWIHPRLFDHFSQCDEIWHAGDIGSIEIADALAAFKPLKAVYGNIDNSIVRTAYKQHLKFMADEIKVWITHIGGTPGHYDQGVRNQIYEDPPDIFICGHSHIAKIMYDKKAALLYVNPGAAGYHGFHKFMTAIRFEIDGKKYNAVVYAVDPKIDLNTRTLVIRALYPNKKEELKPGRYTSVTLLLSQVDDAIAIPTEALIPEMEGEMVYVYRGGKAESVKVETGLRTESLIQIVNGLKFGDTLITTGILQLRHNLPVVLDTLITTR